MSKLKSGFFFQEFLHPMSCMCSVREFLESSKSSILRSLTSNLSDVLWSRVSCMWLKVTAKNWFFFGLDYLNFHQRQGFLWREQLPRQLWENIVIEHWKVRVSYYRHSSVWGWAKKRSKHNSGENFQKYSSPLKTMPAEFKQSVGVNSRVSVSVVHLSR